MLHTLMWVQKYGYSHFSPVWSHGRLGEEKDNQRFNNPKMKLEGQYPPDKTTWR